MMTLANDVDFAVGMGAIRDLLERNGIAPSDVGRLHRIKDVRLYQGLAKIRHFDPDTEAEWDELEVQDMASVVLHPKWEDGPEWPVVQPGPAVKMPAIKATASKVTGRMQKAVIWPDIQVGFYHDRDNKLVSTHDEQALEIALSITRDTKPDLVVLVGDNADLPEFGKYRLSPAFQQTTQASIDYLTELMFRIRAAAPLARIVWLAGNHEERLPNYILDNAAAAFGLRQGARPDAWPALSIPHLCRLDESGIEFLPGYSANDFWINENLRVIHGNKVKSSGSTAHEYLRTEKVSVIYGHIHRIEKAHRTFRKWDGDKTIMAASPGTLAKVDGAVPSTKGGMDLHGRPLKVVEDWQQGLAVVEYRTSGDHKFFYHPIDIINYEASYGGKLYSA